MCTPSNVEHDPLGQGLENDGSGRREAVSGSDEQIPAGVISSVFERMRTLADLLPHMLWITDPQGKAIYNNRRYYEFTGLSRADDDGWAWMKVLHPDDLLVANEEGTLAALENRDFQLEVRCRASDGSYRWHLLHAMPLPDGKSEKPYWFGTATDIDDQKRAHDELSQSQSQLKILADAIPHMVFTAGADGELDFVNQRWYEYTGLSDEQILGNGWQLLIHSDDRKKYISDWNNAIETGDTFEQEFRLKRAVGYRSQKSERYLWHLARVVAMRGADGEIVKWFGTWTEIEDQKRTKTP